MWHSRHLYVAQRVAPAHENLKTISDVGYTGQTMYRCKALVAILHVLVDVAQDTAEMLEDGTYWGDDEDERAPPEYTDSGNFFTGGGD